MREAAEFGFEGARGFTVGIVHPGFMHTEMTKGGVDKCWDRGGNGPWVGEFFLVVLASESSALLFSFLVAAVCCYCYWYFLWEGGWSDTDVTVAVTPDVAAKPLAEWVETFGMDKTGQYWAPRGAADIGTAEPRAEG